MATTNRLDASGLLYEGSDFGKWRDALRLYFAQHFPDLSWSCNWGFPYPPSIRQREICDSIWWQVSPYVRYRVPEESRKSTGRLFSALRATARPFRFMDLPAEIRYSIYQLELPAKTHTQTLTLLKRRFGRSSPAFEYNGVSLVEPQILATSRQIRAEALPLYYKDSHVELMFSNRVYKARLISKLRPSRPTNADRVCAINRWAATIKPDSIRLLRKISVQLPFLAMCSLKGREDMLHFSLSTSNDKPKVHVTPHAWLNSVSQELLHNHASVVSNLAHVLNLEGEALIMVLMSRPDIWDQLKLADE